MKAYGRSRRTALIILNFGTRWRWVVNITPRPLYPRQKPLQFTGEYEGCTPKPVWTIWRRQYLSTTRIRTPGRPSPSLYRRHHLASKGEEFPDRLSHHHQLRRTALNAESHRDTQRQQIDGRRPRYNEDQYDEKSPAAHSAATDKPWADTSCCDLVIGGFMGKSETKWVERHSTETEGKNDSEQNQS